MRSGWPTRWRRNPRVPFETPGPATPGARPTWSWIRSSRGPSGWTDACRRRLFRATNGSDPNPGEGRGLGEGDHGDGDFVREGLGQGPALFAGDEHRRVEQPSHSSSIVAPTTTSTSAENEGSRGAPSMIWRTSAREAKVGRGVTGISSAT